MVSITDVARRAGISISTVSRFFHEPDRVKAKTRLRIQAAIHELGYAPNVLARNFRMGSTRIILVLTSGAGDAFYREVTRGITSVAGPNNYTVRIQEVRLDQPDPNGIAHLIASRQADGIIVLGHAGPLISNGEMSTTDLSRLPIVVCGETSDPALNNYPRYQIDGFAAASDLTKYIIRLGHRKIGFMSGAMPLLALTDREDGYRAAMREAGLMIYDGWQCKSDMTSTGARRAVSGLLGEQDLPTAIICATDEMALGTMAELQARGLQVPADISVAGFDDISYASLANPPLTTISQPGVEIGQRGADCLLRMLEGKPVSAGIELLPHQLIVRKSVRDLCEVPKQYP